MKQLSLTALVIILLISCTKDSEVKPETQNTQESINIDGKWVVLEAGIFDTLIFYGNNQYIIQYSNNNSGNNYHYGKYTKTNQNTFDLEKLGLLSVNKTSRGYEFEINTDTVTYKLSVKGDVNFINLDEKTAMLCKVWKKIDGSVKALFLPNNTYYGSYMPNSKLYWEWSSSQQDSICTKYLEIAPPCELTGNRVSIVFNNDTMIGSKNGGYERYVPAHVFP